MSNLVSTQPNRGWSFWWKPALFLLVACIGLYYVKWSPYYFKAFVAADNHSIGASILNDQQTSPLAAALAYAQVYFLAIWKAAVLAVILGSLLQVLIPRDWLLRLFGRAGLGSTCAAGLLRAARNDVQLLRGTGGGRHAPAASVSGRGAGVLDRQPGAEPGHPGIHGVCAGLGLRRR